MSGEERTYYTYQTPHGPLTIGARSGQITHIVLGERTLEGRRVATGATTTAAEQALEYLAGKRTAFDVPLAPEGTDFQKQVWRQVAQVPYGATITATELADKLGRPNARRSVGAALAKCPIALAIPCHRVTGTTWQPQVSDQAAALRALESR